jgi:uncharacterized coiled-coil DUF342 family protein
MPYGISRREDLLSERRLLYESIADHQAQADELTREINARFAQLKRMDSRNPALAAERDRLFASINQVRAERQGRFNTISEMRDRIRQIKWELEPAPRGPFNVR